MPNIPSNRTPPPPVSSTFWIRSISVIWCNKPVFYGIELNLLEDFITLQVTQLIEGYFRNNQNHSAIYIFLNLRKIVNMKESSYSCIN